MNTINPEELYTSKEAQKLLKISDSTMKRLIKKGIIKASKLGGNYRIFGKELLNALSPKMEKKAEKVYGSLKNKTKKAIKNW